MRSLVTGATGFIGSNVARALIQRGDDVRVLVRADADRRNLAGLPVEIAVGDVRDARSLDRAVPGCRRVFHVAALYSFWAPEPLLVEINVEGTRNVLAAAERAGVETIVHTSSVAALGTPSDGAAADETTPVDAGHIIGAYKRSKYHAEQVALEAAGRGQRVVVVNPSFPVGPGDVKPTPTGRVVVDFLNGRMPAYVDTGMNVVDVRDVAAGHALAAEKGRSGERYILGGENLTMREFLEQLAAVERAARAARPSAVRPDRGPGRSERVAVQDRRARAASHARHGPNVAPRDVLQPGESDPRARPAADRRSRLRSRTRSRGSSRTATCVGATARRRGGRARSRRGPSRPTAW